MGSTEKKLALPLAITKTLFAAHLLSSFPHSTLASSFYSRSPLIAMGAAMSVVRSCC